MNTKYYAVWQFNNKHWVVANRFVNGQLQSQTRDKPLPLPLEELREWMIKDWWVSDELTHTMSLLDMNRRLFRFGWVIKEVDGNQFLREQHAMKYL